MNIIKLSFAKALLESTLYNISKHYAIFNPIVCLLTTKVQKGLLNQVDEIVIIVTFNSLCTC